MVVSPQVSEQHLVKTLGQGILPELSEQIQKVKLIAPEMGKLFWRSRLSSPGIYTVIQGKVRVIDRQNNLVATLTTGESFGELTLFAEINFQEYSVRASANTKLAYWDCETIIPLIQRRVAIREHLYLQAKLKDLLLLNYRVSQTEERGAKSTDKDLAKSIDLHQILPRLNNYQLPVGILPKLVWQEDFFWLRGGEISNASGQKLILGKTYTPRDLTSTEWMIESPADLYCFRLTDQDAESIDRGLNKLDSDLVKLYSPESSDRDGFDDDNFGETTPIKIVATEEISPKTESASKTEAKNLI